MKVIQQDTCYTITVQPNMHKMRIDKLLALNIMHASRTQIQKAIHSGNVTVNSGMVTDCKYQVKPSDEIVLNLSDLYHSNTDDAPGNEEVPKNNTLLSVIYEDNDLLVVDKPPFLVTHPGAGNYGNTMADILVSKYGQNLSTIGGSDRLGIVHRLDKNTSGLLLVAKNNYAHAILAKDIAERNVERYYNAIVYGVPATFAKRDGSVIANIGRSKQNRTKMTIMKAGGRHAVTHYSILEIYGNNAVSFLQCKLDTGRTHQIRVHMSSLKTPVIGDKLYIADQNFNLSSLNTEAIEQIQSVQRQMLHARYLKFNHPRTGQSMSFESQLPEDMACLLEKLHNSSH